MNIKIKLSLWFVATITVTVIVVYLLKMLPKYFPVESFLFAFELHFLLMAWYAFSLPKLKLQYNSFYYEPKSFEKKGLIYSCFGVNVFRKFLKIIQWERFSNSANGKIKYDLTRLKKREKHTREAELAHIILVFHFIVIALFFCQTYNVFWLLFLNVLFHLYPVFVQRYNRPRYLQLISIIELRKNLE
ncbi:hypothetical protein [Winogradskyella sp.]|uniref:glycosyl-4,4'-diaponeurosporenoate acyltransferase CrtO family protein n=1 Tax=Winogradskyella sp. TaxID=1883156 RepID=UPI0025F2C413|nr:hypothetical protein [Winogradskyella sp.]MCT4628584.1 hypothetical protein [Winogradskyella sp.]